MVIAHVRRWLLVPSSLTGASVATAQDGRRIYEEQLRVELDQQQAAAQQMGLDGGGWFSFNYFKYDDNTNRERDLTEYDLLCGPSLSAQRRAYLLHPRRGRLRGLAAGHVPEPVQRPRGRAGLLQVRLQPPHPQPDRPEPAGGLYRPGGRDYYVFGTGLALAQTLDAVDISVNAGDWQVRALLGKFLGDWTNPIDNSTVVENENHRCLWGFEARYKGFQDHEPFAYFFQTHDNNGIHTAGQDYAYDSRYLGIGSTGKFLLNDLRYSTEFVYEGGQSTAFNSTSKDEIQAFGLDAMLAVSLPDAASPAFYGRIPVGHGRSGPAELFRAPSWATGRAPPTMPSTPSASAIRGWPSPRDCPTCTSSSSGASFFPLENVAFFRKMEVGTRSYLYVKDSTNGGLSDLSAGESSNCAGFEQDVFVDYRITSDLSMTVRYGVFTPGTAFDSREIRNAFLTGLVYSF